MGTVLAAAPGVRTGARADSNIPDDRNINIDFFDRAPGPNSLLTVEGANLLSAKRYELSLGMDFMTNPLTVFTVGTDGTMLTNRSDVVKSLLAAQLAFTYGLTDKLQLAADLPLMLSLHGDGLDTSTGQPMSGGLSASGTGDLRVEGAYHFWNNDQFALAGVLGLTAPTASASGKFLGEQFPTVRPRVAAEWTSKTGYFGADLNIGLILRKERQLYSSDVGQQLTYGAGGVYHANSKIDVLAEMFGRNGFGDKLDQSPLEIDGAIRFKPTAYLTVDGGGGSGIIKGLGSPTMRLFVMATYSPDYGDDDHDGVPNMKDQCPREPEDRDGYQDADGCPDPDNDGDGIPDVSDKCPNAKEDLDGFQDDDGCPDPDNDGDGIPDEKDLCPNDAEDKLPPKPADGCPASKTDSDGDGIMDDKDKCPDQAEDMDGFQDEDGCPDPDNDNDGIPDEKDKCPNQAEDKDGFQDEDGCPDIDNDQDGVLDAQDKCPTQKETINGVKDDDGCPDSGGQSLASMNGDQVVLSQGVAWNGATISDKSKPMLAQVAMHMIAQTAGGVKKWKIVVAPEKQATADASRALGQQRADALKAYFVSRGVPEYVIETTGAATDTATVAIVASERDQSAQPEPEPEIEITP
jgi:outer membrane protein OmpA-like peptidoglycan-associated protein